MKTIATALLVCLLPAALCWDFPGYPGVDCPTAREKIPTQPHNGWMLPKCNDDGTYQDMQCFDVDAPDVCMCTYKDGTPITLPGFGLNTTSCICLVVSYDRYVLDKEENEIGCKSNGYFKPLQCSRKTGECWCVSRYGNVVAPPSKERNNCDDVADKY